MRTKVINEAAERTYALVFETGEEAASGLLRFAQENNLSASRFTAIGAFERMILGYFDRSLKDYEKIAITEQVEVLSLIGDIAMDGAKPKVHAHVVVGKRDGTAHGGHLIEAYVRPTLEVMLIESPNYLARTYDAASGLALIDISR